MRIPWYIYAPLSLIVTFGTLFYYIKDVDTVTPPSSEVISASIAKWRQDNPSIRHTQLSDIPQEAIAHLTPEPTTQPQAKPKPVTPPKQPKLVKQAAKIPETSPALDSLVQLNLTTKQLTSYAELTLENNKPQLARIAYERIIDTAKDATAKDRESAAKHITKLKTLTPLWNPDSSTRRQLTINLTLNTSYTKYTGDIIADLEKIIFDSSDGTLELNLILTPTTAPLSSVNIGENSPLVTFTLETKSDVYKKIPAALYYSIRHTNNNIQKHINIPPIPTNITPKQALETYITRLAWVNAAY